MPTVSTPAKPVAPPWAFEPFNNTAYWQASAFFKNASNAAALPTVDMGFLKPHCTVGRSKVGFATLTVVIAQISAHATTSLVIAHPVCDLSNINRPCGKYASQPKETDVHIPPQVSHNPMASLSGKLSLQSRTQDHIVLPEAQALQAIDQLHEKGFHILGWHAWTQTIDGVMEQHCPLQNPDELAKLPRKQAAETCKRSIQAYAQQWTQEHPDPTTQLYFCLRVPPKQSSARSPISMS